MPPRHFGLIPKSARREPIRSEDDAPIMAIIVLFVVVALIAFTVFFMAILALIPQSHGRELYPGQYAQAEGVVSKWFRELMQPDNPMISCCGVADAYYADSYAVSDKGEYIAIITDEREHAPLGRIPRAAGARFLVPNYKIKFDRGNPTGHGVVFIGGTGDVLCYVPPGGV